MTPYTAGRNEALTLLLGSPEKQASFQEARAAFATRNAAPSARVAGRNLAEFRQNAARYKTKAPNFYNQVMNTADAIEATMKQRLPGSISPVPGVPRRNPKFKGRLLPIRLGPSMEQPSNYFSPLEGIRLSAPNPFTAAHEAGHAVDAANGVDITNPRKTLPVEYSATRRAFDALKGTNPGLASATGTYVQYHSRKGYPDRLGVIGDVNASTLYGSPTDSPSLSDNPFGLRDRLAKIVRQNRNKLVAVGQEVGKGAGRRAQRAVSAEDLKFIRKIPAGGFQAMTPENSAQLPVEMRQALARENMLHQALERRAEKLKQLEAARSVLDNPFLNPKVAPNTARDRKAVQHEENLMAAQLNRGIGPGAGEAAQQFLADQRAAAAADPHFGERYYRQQVERLGMQNDPEVRRLLSRFTDR